MSFLTKQTSWSNMELWLFKVCLFSGGIAAGLFFYLYIEEYFMLFLSFFIVTTIFVCYIWIKKLNVKTEK